MRRWTTLLTLLVALVIVALLAGACGSSTPSGTTPSGGATSTEDAGLTADPNATFEPDETLDPNATLEPDATEDPNATEPPVPSYALNTDDPNATKDPDATELPLPSDDPSVTDDPNPTDEPVAGGGGVEMKIIITGGDYAGTYEGNDDTGVCVFGTNGTSDDFKLTAALSDPADPGEPTKNFALSVTLPDRTEGVRGTTALTLVLGLGDADAQIDYLIDSLDQSATKGSGTAKIVISDTTVALTLSGDAELETINGPGDASKIEITATCRNVVGQ